MDTNIVANPFELMLNPQAVLEAMERSQRLESLERRVYRPLDKPLLARKSAEDAALDEEIEADDGFDSDAD
jgi:hypothetical protein